MYRVLVINPGATSTKIAVFEDDKEVFSQTVEHQGSDLTKFKGIYEQEDYRRGLVLQALADNQVELSSLDAVVARGGLMKPLAGGTYAVNEAMIADLKEGAHGEHASNLGAALARSVAAMVGNKPAYIVDPVSVDELSDVARVSGFPGIQRKSMCHALNMKAMARRAAKKLGKRYQEARIITAHLGTGITMAAHEGGRMIDIVDGRVEGPFSADRSGDIPTDALIALCYSGKYTLEEIRRKLARGSGLFAYFGTRDIRVLEQKIAEGDEEARIVMDALAYQIAKGIGELAAVLAGRVDVIVLTGGMAYSDRIVEQVRVRTGFIAPIDVYPGEAELAALAAGAERVLAGEEDARCYA